MQKYKHKFTVHTTSTIKTYAQNSTKSNWESNSHTHNLSSLNQPADWHRLRGSRIPIFKTEGNSEGNRITAIPIKRLLRFFRLKL